MQPRPCSQYKFRHSSLRGRQAGVGLIEVLITLFVISFSIIGIVALQMTATNSNKESFIRSQAMVIAEELAERMRANRQYINRTATSSPVLVDAVDNLYSNAAAYNYESMSCTGERWPCFCRNRPDFALQGVALTMCRDEQGAAAVACSAEQMALFDAWETSCAAAKVDEGLRISVICDDSDGADTDACSANSKYSIMLSWPKLVWKEQSIRSNANCGDDNNCVFFELIQGGS